MSNARTSTVLGLAAAAALLAAAGCASRRAERSRFDRSGPVVDLGSRDGANGTSSSRLAEATMDSPPPALRNEEIPEAPSLRHVWVPGFWKPNEGYWATEGYWEWVPGSWQLAPSGASEWVPSRVERSGDEFEWTAGHWR